MKLDIINLNNDITGQIDLHPEIFGLEPQEDILYKIIHWQLAKRRAGTHQVKERGDVRGSTRKIYKQKGTGKARHGAIRGAQFRGGGIIFGPHFRSHEYKINKKVRKLGLKFALSSKLKEVHLTIMDEFNLSSHKTADLKQKLGNFNAKSILIIDNNVNENVKKSCANIHTINVLPVAGINVYDIIRHEKLIITVDALNAIKERLA
ncbi:50S ribosomal protein L4 [endosymbiont of Acanthamoeba sp. UWC8]|uniref:50S ribosomal protein L4 n=1 Tax=endosymbiont of Acanthamoeba sp. UWC8 TaxID=86106 RepID=UPI0004D1A13A|nr:50S ribosomal protein L4 [endosymbiont of Acanthamoeba sp. UWC8]AIF81732.1 50S ribosomal protein L4 [endosymbiont of Acanthamoeba sp. UWC8]